MNPSQRRLVTPISLTVDGPIPPRLVGSHLLAQHTSSPVPNGSASTCASQPSGSAHGNLGRPWLDHTEHPLESMNSSCAYYGDDATINTTKRRSYSTSSHRSISSSSSSSSSSIPSVPNSFVPSPTSTRSKTLPPVSISPTYGQQHTHSRFIPGIGVRGHTLPHAFSENSEDEESDSSPQRSRSLRSRGMSTPSSAMLHVHPYTSGPTLDENGVEIGIREKEA